MKVSKEILLKINLQASHIYSIYLNICLYNQHKSVNKKEYVLEANE